MYGESQLFGLNQVSNFMGFTVVLILITLDAKLVAEGTPPPLPNKSGPTSNPQIHRSESLALRDLGLGLGVTEVDAGKLEHALKVQHRTSLQKSILKPCSNFLGFAILRPEHFPI